MCLIAHVPKGKSLTREVFDKANNINPHGIGVMSSQGIEKFYGNKQLKRARQYVADLAKQGLAHAVHWRYATHGTRGLALCHPFKLPNAEVWLMHNGIISKTSQEATDDASDTLLYVNSLTDAPAALVEGDLTYWSKIANDIGQSNKALVMYPDGKFIILNQENGCKVDDIWYSNSYSLPMHMRPNGYQFTPSRLLPKRPANTYYPNSGSYYNTGRNSSAFGGPYGALIYWSEQMKAYGFWEGSKFIKLHLTEEVIDRTITTTPVQSSLWQTRARDSVDFDTGEIDDRKCPLCLRFKLKKDAPQGFLSCWCPPDRVDAYIAAQRERIAAKQAVLDAAHPSGPTLETLPEMQPKSKLPADQCEHGNTNWEDCRECIAEVEADNGSEVQRWLAHRAGYRIRSTNPDERADELASNVIALLPRQSER